MHKASAHICYHDESRIIPISDTLKDTLLELKEHSKSDFVFTTHEGNPYSSNTAWKRAWNTALKKCGIGKCRFHDLRHTFCSNLIVGEKEDFARVMELTGHKDIRMLKRYSHTHQEAKIAAIEKLGNRLKMLVRYPSYTPNIAIVSLFCISKPAEAI